MYILSVSDLNEQIKALIEESFSRVIVEGELSRITFHNSGHIYFSLKDNNSTISCVMFKGNATKLRFSLEEGLKVKIDGALSLYKPRGSYQINCFSIEPAGQGALALAYEQLKEKLEKKGYFDPKLKKTLPIFPKKVALITSQTGAALQDMLRIVEHRYKLVEIVVYDVLVQGRDAANSISSAIRKADELSIYDVLVVGRGGGSIEDLWAFNEEIVADAIFYAKTPIISAVGHEIDFVLSDFCADLRAATPTAAIQMLLPDTTELLLYIDNLREQLYQYFDGVIQKKSIELQHTKDLFLQNSVDEKILHQQEEILFLKKQFFQQIDFKMINFEKNLESMQMLLESKNPKYNSKKGFAQISKNGKIIELNDLKLDEKFSLMDTKNIILAKVIKKEEIK